MILSWGGTGQSHVRRAVLTHLVIHACWHGCALCRDRMCKRLILRIYQHLFALSLAHVAECGQGPDAA